MKKILIHAIAFSPDGVSTAYLYNDIALKFKSENYHVVVLTTTPHYNVIHEELAKQPMIAKLGGLYYESFYHGIKVIHVPQRKFRSSLLRILGFVYWHFLSFILALSQKNISVILSPSPPLTIGLINILIGKIKNAKVIYNVQEIYPDFLINQGKLNFKPFLKILKSIEHFVYNHSTAVTTIDRVFYETIFPRFKDPSKLKIIPNFVDTDLFKPTVSMKAELDPALFPEKKDVLKVMYAGNIGLAQDWLPLIRIAKEMKESGVEFWVIGEGVMKNYLVNEVEENKLINVHIIPYQPREQMPSIVGYADLHFIFMAPEMEGQGFPSKVYTIMACAKPLLVISGKDTPIYNFLDKYNCSLLVGDKSFDKKCETVISFLNMVKSDPDYLKKLGGNGFEAIENEYSTRAVTKQYVDLVDEILLKSNKW